MKWLLLILSLCISCSAAQYKPSHRRDIDLKLIQYVETFETLYKTEVNFPVKIRRLKKAIGVCRRTKSGKKIVLIDTDYYQRYFYRNEIMEAIVFHELGHCVFNLDHDSSRFDNQYPISLMFPNVFAHNKLYYRNYYIHELYMRILEHQHNQLKGN